MSLTTWVDVEPSSPFPLENLPYGVFSRPGQPPRVGVAIGDLVLDMAAVVDLPELAAPSLNPFMAMGPQVWTTVREQVTELLSEPSHRRDVEPFLAPAPEVGLHLPFDVADYVDFYSSRHHAENLGRLFRPGQDPLTPNWRHLPLGYHGRSGTVVVSGTPVVRPAGQRPESGGAPSFGPSRRLDIEAEVGFVVGTGSHLGDPVPPTAFADHVFGVVLVNDWSARDLQAWEYVPLGPFLGKSFATSVSPWVVPLAALEAARVDPPAQEPPPLPYLGDGERWGLDLSIEVELNGEVITRPPFRDMYWTAAQQLAHLTVNGASLRTGDLVASGTVSGAGRSQCGSLIELTWNGTEPVRLADGTTRAFLEDGDEVVLRASAPAAAGGRLGFGEVRGTIVAG